MDHLELIFVTGISMLDNCHRIVYPNGTLFPGLCKVVP